jgi:hypothetical protein
MRLLDAGLRRRIEFLSFVFRTHVPDLLMPDAEGAASGFEDEPDRLRSVEPELLPSAFVRPLADHEMWAGIEEQLEQSIGEAGRRLEQGGVWSVLGRLPRNCRVDRARHEHLTGQVSKALQRLAEADLITPKRDGYYVVHHLVTIG